MISREVDRKFNVLQKRLYRSKRFQREKSSKKLRAIIHRQFLIVMHRRFGIGPEAWFKELTGVRKA